MINLFLAEDSKSLLATKSNFLLSKRDTLLTKQYTT